MIRELLEKVSRGEIGIEDAQEEIVRALYEQGEDFLLDLHRHHRTGFPEVIYARGKSTDQVLRIVRSFLDKAGRAFVSLIDDELEDALRRAFPDARTVRAGGLAVVASGEAHRERLGTVGILTAGTADTPHAGECGLLLEEIGVNVIRAFDFGASGMHRPFLGIRKTGEADVLIVFAGMDGILPTMIASLTDKPVIAVPTPVGYGLGGGGDTALRTMLQSCVPGLVVLNIGNSVGAAAAAVRILRSIRRRMNGQV
ncbi:MAG: AIR carboxylase [Deltaproteobacteria bacterium ADurb.BinA179]|nr:MAG: AIR carboxylase [Deltaproteobacteria bacterium ADurb.BinA179]HNU73872.1 nickel pincer cofactor biosynthesis protein LarB [Deltaproteobacteria bacterium]HOE72977.1 nickel pincer cofactor biosynthesis protein LarB [Deltaproteobacteria bacterium]HPA83967.1 nickel pincer cofactor biosynthesis protein LarB [Deltaproteobacteria bacterium]HPV28333.1 nickel pincer cofactor biosynthesis protein LarB [Deltaproteobacteria bacterium]